MMNNRYTYNLFYRCTSYLVTTLCIFSGLMACSEKEGPVIFPEKKVTISLKLNTGEYVTRAGTDPSSIRTVHVIILEKEEGETSYQYQYLATPERGEENDRYKITLYPTEQPVKLVLIANIENIASYLSSVTTEKEIREALLISFEDGEIDSLPMYGEIVYENGITEESTPIEEISMLRGVAAVEVSLTDALYQKGTFLLKSVQAYRANDRIQVIPDPSALHAEEWKVTTPSVPQDAENIITTPSVSAGDTREQSLGPVYLPESEAVANITSGATCLIIGGVYKDGEHANSTTTTYYRIDFKDGNENPTGQVLRNHQYKMTISAVSGPGTTHPDDANSKNIETMISEWEDSDHDIDL